MLSWGTLLLPEEVDSDDVVCETSLNLFVYSLSSCCSLSDRVVGIGWFVVLNFIGSFVSWMYVKGCDFDSCSSFRFVMVSLTKSCVVGVTGPFVDYW